MLDSWAPPCWIHGRRHVGFMSGAMLDSRAAPCWIFNECFGDSHLIGFKISIFSYFCHVLTSIIFRRWKMFLHYLSRIHYEEIRKYDHSKAEIFYVVYPQIGNPLRVRWLQWVQKYETKFVFLSSYTYIITAQPQVERRWSKRSERFAILQCAIRSDKA